MLSYLKRIIFIPCAVYTSVVIGGGYGTGREIVEFFSSLGATLGLVALLSALIVFVIVLFLTFELARLGDHYDYRTFFKALIGRVWWLFEVLYLALMFLVLGVVTSAASHMLAEQFGLQPLVGTSIIVCLIGLSLLAGRLALERVMVVCLMAMYALFVAYFGSVAGEIDWGSRTESSSSTSASAIWSGALYAFYNLSLVPVLLFCVRDLRSRGEAAISAISVGCVILIPAVLFHLSFTLTQTDVTAAAVPVYAILNTHGASVLVSAFVLVLMITLAQTGAGLLQGLIERVEASEWFVHSTQEGMNAKQRLVFVVVVLGISALLGSIGVITLIGQGYSTLAVGFGLVYVLPLLLIGLPRVLQHRG